MDTSAAQHALNETDGPASQLPTARVLNGARVHDNMYMANTSNSDMLEEKQEKQEKQPAAAVEKKKDNPFRSRATKYVVVTCSRCTVLDVIINYIVELVM